MQGLIQIFNEQIFYMLHVESHYQYEKQQQFHLRFQDQEVPLWHALELDDNEQIHGNVEEEDCRVHDWNKQLAQHQVTAVSIELLEIQQVDHKETN